VLFAIDLHEHFINEECVAVASVLELQSSSVYGSEFNAPKPDRFSADHAASLGQEVYNVAVTKVETVVQPDCVADDIGWKSVTLVSIHEQILHMTCI
jgi:hypothetical protein